VLKTKKKKDAVRCVAPSFLVFNIFEKMLGFHDHNHAS
jgi:hypothetical protein